jgi:hypothetical protein
MMMMSFLSLEKERRQEEANIDVSASSSNKGGGRASRRQRGAAWYTSKGGRRDGRREGQKEIAATNVSSSQYWSSEEQGTDAASRERMRLVVSELHSCKSRSCTIKGWQALPQNAYSYITQPISSRLSFIHPIRSQDQPVRDRASNFSSFLGFSLLYIRKSRKRLFFKAFGAALLGKS